MHPFVLLHITCGTFMPHPCPNTPAHHAIILTSELSELRSTAGQIDASGLNRDASKSYLEKLKRILEMMFEEIDM